MNTPAVSFLGFVDDAAHLALDDRKAFKRVIDKLKGQEVIVTLRRRPKRQGSQSMRYYRGVVIPDLAKACGYPDPDDYPSVHDAMAWKFLRLPDGQFGEPRRRHTSKDDMNQEEMSHYIDAVIMWAETSVPNCTIRRPDDVDMDRVVDEEWT